MIDRVVRLPFWAGTTSSFNGHLWMLQYWLYRAQIPWFGVDDNTFIRVVFICGVAATAVVLTRRSSLTASIVVGTLALSSVGVDSGTGIIGVTLVGVAAFISWRGLPTLGWRP